MVKNSRKLKITPAYRLAMLYPVTQYDEVKHHGSENETPNTRQARQ